MALTSHFLLRGENYISGNTAVKGGGIFLCSGSFLRLHNGTYLSITGNHANYSGGGIYIDGGCSPAVTFCFFQVDNITANNATLSKTQVYLISNTAGSGSAIYGGRIDWCILFDAKYYLSMAFASKIFNDTFHIQEYEHDLSVISSDPMYVGFCKINVSTTELNLDNCKPSTSEDIMPGKTLSVSAVLMGQRYGLVSGLIVATCAQTVTSKQEYSQYIGVKSSAGKYLNYTVSSKENRNVTLQLVAEDYFLISCIPVSAILYQHQCSKMSPWLF